MLVVAGCSTTPTPQVIGDDVDLQSGRDLFIRNCTSCHGSAGQGGRGSKLNEGRVAERYPDIADQLEVVSDGRGGMPAFSGRLDEDQVEQVVRFTREVL